MNSTDQHPSPIRDITFDAQIRHQPGHPDLSSLRDKNSRVYSLPDRSGEIIFTGELLANASSRVEQHSGHLTGDFATKGDKCKACRWTETHIFRVTEDTSTNTLNMSLPTQRTKYLIHTMGPSIIPGEFIKCRTEWASTGHEVIELLTVRTPKATYLPAPSARALAQASGIDRRIEEAYVNRAVV